jgi:hypothetical protein
MCAKFLTLPLARCAIYRTEKTEGQTENVGLKKMKKLIIFLDESGNSGEAIPGENSNFSGQPFFVLSGVGIFENEIDKLEEFVGGLKKKYHIQSEEIKGKRLYEKAGLILELADYLFVQQYPLFIELMDKKYYLCIQIVHAFIFGYLKDTSRSSIVFRKRLIEYVYSKLPDELFVSFCTACQEYTRESFEHMRLCFKIFFQDGQSIEKHLLLSGLTHTGELYKKLLLDHKLDREAFTYFLPLPDYNMKNRSISLLPHINAFSNIFFRAAKYGEWHRILDLAFIHDEQVYFDKIINDNFELIKSISFEGIPNPDPSRLSLEVGSISSLVFQNSKTAIMIQVSDIISSAVRKAWTDFTENKDLSVQYKRLFQEYIFPYEQIHKSLGINFVVDDWSHREFVKFVNR